MHEDVAIHTTQHRSGRTGKSLAPQPLPLTTRDPPVLALHGTVGKKLTHSSDGVGVPLDMPVRVATPSLLFPPVPHLRRLLEVLVQAIQGTQVPLLLQITASCFLVVDPSAKLTVMIPISLRVQAVRLLDT